MAADKMEADTIPFAKLRDLLLIGSGGFGEVYRAKHADWGPVAFKRLVVTFIKDNERAAGELRREVAVHSQLRHPNIVMFIGIVFEPQHYGVVLEFATHGDLWCFIRRLHPVGCAWKINMSHGIALGMNYLHTARQRPLIHGDLKMKNILVADGYKPKISDFGLSRWKRYSYEITRRERPGGTVTHIPPENWIDINTSPTEKYDVYSFGILLWELFSERHPFDASNTSTIKEAVVNHGRPQMCFIPREVPEFLTKIITDCWAQTSTERPLFNAVKIKLEGHVNACSDAIKADRLALQQRDKLPSQSTSAGDMQRRQPLPNVQTRSVAHAVVDTVSTRPGFSVQDPGALSYVTGQAGQAAVEMPDALFDVRTNEGLANIQPANTVLSFLYEDVSMSSPQRSVDLHPDDPRDHEPME